MNKLKGSSCTSMLIGKNDGLVTHKKTKKKPKTHYCVKIKNK